MAGYNDLRHACMGALFASSIFSLLLLFAAPAKCTDVNMRVEFDPSAKKHLPQPVVLEWLKRSRDAVTHYYGQFPVKDLLVTIHDDDRDTVGYGSTTWEDGHGSIEITIGDETPKKSLLHAWTATHEMTHLAMPILSHPDRWVAEGMATYIEPLARLQVGQLTPEEVWGDFVRNGPRALPPSGKGLRNVRDFGPMYWGGALWCLLADIEIRQKTKNRFGFQDAMRAIVKAHATADSDYTTEQALQFGDDAIGVAVLIPSYRRFSNGPINVNIDDLWRRLGIVSSGQTVHFDDSAPLARIRHSIETGSL